MVSIKDLRGYKSWGNVFSIKTDSINIIECPQCTGTNFQSIEIESEKVYLNEID